MAYLLAERGKVQGRHDLAEDLFLIGRKEGCSLVLDDPQVSREHARIVREGDRFYIEDLGSRHGTFVNGRRLTARLLLAESDVIAICENTFAFHAEADSEPEEKPIIMSALDATPYASETVEVRPEVKLRAVLEINRSLGSVLHVDELLPKILDSLFRVFPQAHRGSVLLVDEGSGALLPKAVLSRGRERDDGVRISQTVVNRALEARQAILSEDARLDSNFQMSQSVSLLGIRSIMCAPLLGQDQTPLGILQVHSEDRARSFTEEDLAVFVSVASATAMALENARLHESLVAREKMRRELELARDVQRRFLPPLLPRAPGYDFYSFYAAARVVGGDYYGFIELPGKRLVLAIGDVAGKGMPAAMLMAKLSSDVRYAALTHPDPGAALQSLNRTLLEAEMEDKFVTLVLMVLDSVRHTLTVANAGHPPPLLRSGGAIEEVGAGIGGLPLGVSLDARFEYRTATVPLLPGAVVLAYTDGLSEAAGPGEERFGAERLRARFLEGPADAAGAGKWTVDGAMQFAAGVPQHDDVTLVSFGRESP